MSEQNYREQVIGAAIDTLQEGGMPNAELFRALFERIYDCGYNEAQREQDLAKTIKRAWR